MQYTNASIGGVEQFVSYLPLSHIASQLVDIYTPLASAGTVWFAQPDAMKVCIKSMGFVCSMITHYVDLYRVLSYKR